MAFFWREFISDIFFRQKVHFVQFSFWRLGEENFIRRNMRDNEILLIFSSCKFCYLFRILSVLSLKNSPSLKKPPIFIFLFIKFQLKNWSSIIYIQERLTREPWISEELGSPIFHRKKKVETFFLTGENLGKSLEN